MSTVDVQESMDVIEKLAEQGYWPAQAARHLQAGRYSSSVELCRAHIKEEPDLLSGLLVYAVALHRAGQLDTAIEQYHAVLARDPENLVALKNLADIMMDRKEEPVAVAMYERVLRLDPYCRALKSDIKPAVKETTRTISLKRQGEGKSDEFDKPEIDIPFFTETIGDLYLQQGYPRLAATVFNRLIRDNENPRFLEKLRQAREKIKERES